MKFYLLLIVCLAWLAGCGLDSDSIDDVVDDVVDDPVFTLTSEAISDGQILESYTCEKKEPIDTEYEKNSIPLSWSNVPESAGSLAITMHLYPNPDDTTSVNSYLALWGIDPSTTEIPYGKADEGSWYIGGNKAGLATSYTSPCSHSPGTHKYILTLYALSETPPSLPVENDKDINYDKLTEAIATVTTIDTAVLKFDFIYTP
ncbi:MAG: hypothetical protein GY784_19120 [Gammaproteobacteria bacterium]|nr:hypothetical protein [Gammaproteobacteria bacterium]